MLVGSGAVVTAQAAGGVPVAEPLRRLLAVFGKAERVHAALRSGTPVPDELPLPNEKESICTQKDVTIMFIEAFSLITNH